MTDFAPLWSSQSVEWKTPEGLYADLNREFGFTFDPCPYGGRIDGLLIPWGRRTFCNPPYGPPVRSWLRKGLMEIEQPGRELVCFLLAARTDTKWFHDLVLPFADEIRFIRGRLKFSGHRNSAPFPSMIVIYNSTHVIRAILEPGG